MSSRQDIENMLHSLGYEYEVQDNSFLLTFQGEYRKIKLWIRTSDQLLYIATLFMKKQVITEELATYKQLLSLNHLYSLIKFAIDPDGDIIASVEYPLSQLQIEELDTGIRTLVTVVDEESPHFSTSKNQEHTYEGRNNNGIKQTT